MLGSVSFGSVRGGVIISGSAVIILLVCSCSPSADMILVKALGLGMALAVALDATLVRGLLVPATMRLLGDWNWWLPFVGVQRRQPVLAESTDVQEREQGKEDELHNVLGEDAQVGGKQ